MGISAWRVVRREATIHGNGILQKSQFREVEGNEGHHENCIFQQFALILDSSKVVQRFFLTNSVFLKIIVMLIQSLGRHGALSNLKAAGKG